MNDYHKVIEENVNDDTLYTDFNALMTAFTRQRFDNYQHQKNYKFFGIRTFMHGCMFYDMFFYVVVATNDIANFLYQGSAIVA